MEWLYISILVAGIIILIASVFLLKSKEKNNLINLVIIVFSIIMIFLSVLVFFMG